MQAVLGIDIGGTAIKAGLFSLEGTLLNTTKIPTKTIVGKQAFDEIIQGLCNLIEDQGYTPSDICAIGLDVPGSVDDQGRVGMLSNIELDAEGLQRAIEKAFPSAALAFVNDANAAALGEMWQGSAQGITSFVMVTLGTGVGAGVVVGGELVAGAFGAGGEIGHMTVREIEPRTCGCGRHGCLEQYASAKGIVALYQQVARERGLSATPVEHPTDTITVFNAARAGDEAALGALSIMTDRLGYALAQVSCVIDPRVYLIGGGVSGGYDLFIEQLLASFHKYCIAPCAPARILPCSLGNQAGMYGVAYAALQKLQKGQKQS